jgi:hypothetical protein
MADFHDSAAEEPVPTDDALQFDHAESIESAGSDAPAGPTCAACKQPIDDAYYEISGTVFCGRCKNLIRTHHQGGSKIARLARATAFGSAAAIAGFAIYFAVLKITGWQIGLISVLVGFMVGKAVHTGCRGRGGWLYQALAIFLTYSAICASYSAFVIPELLARNLGAEAEKKEAVAPKPNAAPEENGKPVVEKAEEAEPPVPVPSLAHLAIGLLLLVGLFFAIPIIAGFHSPIGLLIVGFALWEAWKMNRKTNLVINGPFLVGGGAGPIDVEVTYA